MLRPGTENCELPFRDTLRLMDESPKNSTALSIEDVLKSIYGVYSGFEPVLDLETGAGGKLLYGGETNTEASVALRAANIAGAASLAASPDAAPLRQAMREGAIDFVVNSLDEALRILKNEIRKKQPVAVGVSVAPEAVEREMLERGVQPDLLAPQLPTTPELNAFLGRGARRIEQQSIPPGRQFQFFSIPADWKQPASAFDALLLNCFTLDDALNRRWVRMAPRYLPAEARRMRMVVCDAGAGLGVIARLGEAKMGK
jgi:hypothetical protein